MNEELKLRPHTDTVEVEVRMRLHTYQFLRDTENWY